MSFSRRGALLVLGFIAIFAIPPAWAEDGPLNMDAGKNPAQLFANDCAICHKSAQGLAKSAGMFGLQSFLREHYTASKESAALLASYLEAVGAPPAPARERAKRPPKGDGRATAGDGKATKKPGSNKPEQAKPEDAKPSDAKPSDAKPSDSKASDAKASDAKPSDAKPPESKPAESKPEKSD